MQSIQKLVYLILFTLFLGEFQSNAQELTATVNADKTAEMSNGIITMKINSSGSVNYFALNGQDLVNASNKGQFYFSYNSAEYHNLSPNKATLTRQTNDIVEVTHTSDDGEMIINQTYVLKKGVPGVYCYITLKGKSTTINLAEMRVVFRVDPAMFTYAYVSDQCQGRMVSPAELTNVEEVMDATYKLSDGSIYTKYDWANYVDQDIVHGLCNDEYGIWVVSSSDEYLNGGPMKQELMVHGTNKTPLILKMLQGAHFGAGNTPFTPEDEKIYGPFFIYANAGDSKETIIEDAKAYAADEQSKWPYNWMEHQLFPLERTTVTGQLNVKFNISPENMMVVLAEHGKPIYNQATDYMFWSKADADGNFSISNVRPGNYSLYVFATEGEMFDEIEFENIEVSGESTELEPLEIIPTKYDEFLWQIGQPDRTARGFKLSDHRRTYGLWDDVAANLVYTIGESTESENWYYAQTKEGSWEIRFNLDEVNSSMFSYFTLAIAGAASSPEVRLSINNHDISTFKGGNDASVYRSANQGGAYQLITYRFRTSYLQVGMNKLTCKLLDVGNRGGLIYDALKLESGLKLTSSSKIKNVEKQLFKVYPNPADESINIQFRTSEKEKVDLTITDQLGRVVATLINDEFKNGETSMMVDVSKLNRGLYFVNYRSSDSNSYQPFVKE